MARYLPDNWVLPTVDERTSAFFTSGKILLQTCTSCSTTQHPPEDVCHRCQAMEFEFREFAGKGSIYSYTIVRHPVHPALVEAIPYVVVLVSLDEIPDVRITGNLLDATPEQVQIGLPVVAVWEEITDPESGEVLRLPQWKLAG